jgi:hypothetical protein
MAWKAERWLQEVFPGEKNIYSEYRGLPRRELAVVAGAVLDTALAEILSKRLCGPASEIEGFLGLDGDGRSPCASFGARIQLGLVTGILTTDDAIILRTIKNIRNRLAHEVKADFNSKSVLPLILALHDQFLQQSNRLIEAGKLPGPKHSFDVIRPHLPTTPEAGAGLFLAVFCTYQAYFHRIIHQTEQVPLITRK